VTSIVERDGGLVDAFALSNGIGKFLYLCHEVLSFAVAKVGSVGDVANLTPQAIADPEWAITNTSDLFESARSQQGPRQLASVDKALLGRCELTEFGVGGSSTGFVSFMSGFDQLEGGFLEFETVRWVNIFAFAKAASSNVMTEEIGVSSNQVANALSAAGANLSPVERSNTGEVSRDGEDLFPDLASFL
jgi:hypothetical protein